MAALRIVLLILAFGVIGLLGWRATSSRVAPTPALSSPAPSGPTIVSRTLEQALRAPPVPALAALRAVAMASASPAPVAPRVSALPESAAEPPEFLGFYGRLRTDFPRDHAALLGRAGEARPDAAIWDALRTLEQADGILAARAGPAALDRFFDARSAVLAGLAPFDAHRCVDFLYGVTDDGIADFTAAHRGTVAILADRTLDAISDGRSRHGDRPAPTEADFDALSAGLAAFGLTPEEIGLLIDGATPDPPPIDRRLCDVGRIYLDVLRGLPPEMRHRLYGLAAELLSRS